MEMDIKQYDNPDPCVSILIVDEDRVLLGKRGDVRIKPDKWCLPCGYIEGSETIEAAAKREVKEETGIDIEVINIINVTSNHFGDDYTSIVIVILAKALTKDVVPGDDISECGWYRIDKLPEMAFKADIHIINQFVKCGYDLGIPFKDTTIEFFEKYE